MILETKAVTIALPVAAKLAASAGQLIFAGVFLAVGFQGGHTICRKAIEWWDHRSLAQIEKEMEEPDGTT